MSHSASKSILKYNPLPPLLQRSKPMIAHVDEPDVFLYNYMVRSHVKSSNPGRALTCYLDLRRKGLLGDNFTYPFVLKSCGLVMALVEGRQVHGEDLKGGSGRYVFVVNGLIGMYGRCGEMGCARKAFDGLELKDLVSWNLLLAGCVGAGEMGKAQKVFDGMPARDEFSWSIMVDGYGCQKMVSEGIPGDDMIFLGVLTACSHSGLVNDGLRIFDEMRRVHGIEPKLEHYGCLVDLLGRAGRLYQALEIIEAMPMKPNSALWGSLLLACRTHRCSGLAEIAVERLKELGADDCGTYVLLSNIYADAGLWEESRGIRKLLKDMKVGKEMGKSIIEVGGNIVEFASGEDSSTINKVLGEILWSLSKLAFYAG